MDTDLTGLCKHLRIWKRGVVDRCPQHETSPESSHVGESSAHRRTRCHVYDTLCRLIWCKKVRPPHVNRVSSLVPDLASLDLEYIKLETPEVELLVKPGSEWLGSRSRRRTWQAAISLGEVHAAFEPEISECDFVACFDRSMREHGHTR